MANLLLATAKFEPSLPFVSFMSLILKVLNDI